MWWRWTMLVVFLLPATWAVFCGWVMDEADTEFGRLTVDPEKRHIRFAWTQLIDREEAGYTTLPPYQYYGAQVSRRYKSVGEFQPYRIEQWERFGLSYTLNDRANYWEWGGYPFAKRPPDQVLTKHIERWRNLEIGWPWVWGSLAA